MPLHTLSSAWLFIILPPEAQLLWIAKRVNRTLRGIENSLFPWVLQS